jgi:hypothetical protein
VVRSSCQRRVDFGIDFGGFFIAKQHQWQSATRDAFAPAYRTILTQQIEAAIIY